MTFFNITNDEVLVGDGVQWNSLEISSYPDGMPIVPHHHSVYALEDDVMILRPKSMATFIAAMFYCDAMADRLMPVRTLILPFIPGSRQDRLNDQGDSLFTLKSVAKMINDRNFDQVVVVDPHSMVAPALIDRCNVFSMEEIWKQYWKGFSGVIAPDAGAGKRAQTAATIMGLPLHQAEKVRDVATGKLTGFAAPTIIKGEHYLIVDDICDGGGTFLGLAGVIEEKEAFASLFVTHGIFSKGTDELLKKFKTVTTTDSTVFDSPNVLTSGVVQKMIDWSL